jgi:hypothetical protein
LTDTESAHPLRPLLRNWLWERGRVGTRWLDCADGTLGFDEGRKAHFAAEPLIHVPLGPDLPAAADGAAPPWPVVHEAGLARFLRAAQLGRPEEAGTPAEVSRAVHDCVDIALLCAIQAEAREAHARYALEPMFDDEIRDAVIADVRRVGVPLRAQLMLYDWAVFHGLPSPLLTSDSPFVDWRVRARPAVPFVSLPLGPYCLLVGAPSSKTSRAGPVTWKGAVSMGPFKDQNRHVVEGARRWLVAATDEQLLALQPRFAPPVTPPSDTPVAGPA